MSVEQKVTDLIEESLDSLGYELVRVKQLGKDVIQIMIDSKEGVNIDNCAKVTKLINNILYVAEMSNDYNLEVSSPGLDRPLIKAEHFMKYIDSKIKLNTYVLIDGQKRFNGTLEAFDSETNQITLACDSKKVVIDLDQVQSANLQY